ncbi:unnamed protein product, partial [Owenia fusiformis]
YKTSTKLKYLDLSYNDITSISNRAFVTFENLSWLRLEGNPLSITNFASAFTEANLIFWFSAENDNTTRWIEIIDGVSVTEAPSTSLSTSTAFEASDEMTTSLHQTTDIATTERTFPPNDTVDTIL